MGKFSQQNRKGQIRTKANAPTYRKPLQIQLSSLSPLLSPPPLSLIFCILRYFRSALVGRGFLLAQRGRGRARWLSIDDVACVAWPSRGGEREGGLGRYNTRRVNRGRDACVWYLQLTLDTVCSWLPWICLIASSLLATMFSRCSTYKIQQKRTGRQQSNTGQHFDPDCSSSHQKRPPHSKGSNFLHRKTACAPTGFVQN